MPEPPALPFPGLSLPAPSPPSPVLATPSAAPGAESPLPSPPLLYSTGEPFIKLVKPAPPGEVCVLGGLDVLFVPTAVAHPPPAPLES